MAEIEDNFVSCRKVPRTGLYDQSGGERKSIGIDYKNHVNEMAPYVDQLTALETQAQSIFLQRSFSSSSSLVDVNSEIEKILLDVLANNSHTKMNSNTTNAETNYDDEVRLLEKIKMERENEAASSQIAGPSSGYKQSPIFPGDENDCVGRYVFKSNRDSLKRTRSRESIPENKSKRFKDNFTHLTRREKQRLKRRNRITFAVSAENFPKDFINFNQFELITSTILNEIVVNGDPIVTCKYMAGFMKVRCESGLNKQWLTERLVRLVPWKGAVLKWMSVIPQHNSYLAWIPHENMSIKQIFQRLDTQNDGIHTDRWRVIVCGPAPEGGQNLMVWIDGQSEDVLKSNNFYANFEFDKVLFTNRRNPPNKKMPTKKKEKKPEAAKTIR